MMALVEAMAGMTFFTTPCVNCQVTPSILNSAARFEATLYSHSIWSGSSVSSFFSGTRGQQRIRTGGFKQELCSTHP